MYKGASQSLVHRTAVDRPHPSRGFIDGAPDASDVLPDVSRLTFRQMVDEKKQLARELARIVTDLTLAKVERRAGAIAMLGQQHQTVQSRAAAINLRLQAETPNDKSGETLAEAVREICNRELQIRIFKRARQLFRGETGL